MSDPRMTLQTQLVLRALLEEPTRERYGLELCEVVGLPSGTVYPILSRLKQAGWVDSAWEDAARHVAERRPRRRYYKLTPDGAEQARYALAASYRAKRTPHRLWSPQPGGAGGSSWT
jgi:PadR family transcriptional regulator, regulatory protein PadR